MEKDLKLPNFPKLIIHHINMILLIIFDRLYGRSIVKNINLRNMVQMDDLLQFTGSCTDNCAWVHIFLCN